MKISCKIFAYILIISMLSVSLPAIELSDIIPQNQIEKISTLKSSTGRGTIVVSGMNGTFETNFLAPNNVLLTLDFGNFKITQGFDGTTAWMRDQNDQIMEIEGALKKQVINSAFIDSYSFIIKDRMPGEVKFSRDSTIDNNGYAIFDAYPLGGDPISIFVNRDTKRVEIIRAKLDDEISTTYASDFRKISGLELPFNLNAISNITQNNSTMIFEEIIINEPIDENIFLKRGEDFVDYYYPEKSAEVSVTFSYYRGHIYIDGVVNGRKARFILDSGASNNVLCRSFADKLGIESTGDLPSKGVAGYGSASLSEIDSIQIGELCLYNQIVSVIDLSNFGSDSEDGFSGILGYDLLSRFPFGVNFPDSTITFYNPKHFAPPSDDFAVNIEFEMKVPTTTAQYAGHSGKFLIDFGNAFGLILHKSFIEKYNLMNTFTDIMKMTGGIGGVGGNASAYSAVGGKLEIGPVVIEKTALTYTDSEGGLSESVVIDGNIGTFILKDISILLDYERNKIYLLPLETK